MVFSIMGYLTSINSPVSDRYSSYDLIFVAIPTANETLPGGRFWTFIFFLMVFLAGADYAQQLIICVTATLYDDSYYARLNHKKIYYVIAIGVGMFLLGLPFCLNVGNMYLDVIDHYLFSYLGLIIIILECLAVGWLFQYTET